MCFLNFGVYVAGLLHVYIWLCIQDINNQTSQDTQGATNQPASGKKGKKKKQSEPKKHTVRTTNYKQTEDEVICSAYLNVSKDAVVSVNQPAKTYWERIADYFNENRGTHGERNVLSLQHRWGEISKFTSKFCGFYAEIERKNQSGKCEDDKVYIIRNDKVYTISAYTNI